jgi:hypothetical protein
MKVGPHSGRKITAEEHQTVAKLYKEARSLGKPAQKYIAQKLNLAASTTAKRVESARKAGFMEPANWNERRDESLHVNFKLHKNDMAKVQEIIKAKGVTRSWVIREALRQYLDAQKQEGDL